MSTKSALRADLDAEDRKTLAEDRKRMERLGNCSQPHHCAQGAPVEDPGHGGFGDRQGPEDRSRLRL
jgi:hypothetical protein